MYYKNNNEISIIGWLTSLFLLLNPLSASTALIKKPVNWFAHQINWLVSLWRQHWHLMGSTTTRRNQIHLISITEVYSKPCQTSQIEFFLRNLKLSRFWKNLWFMTEDQRFYCIWNKNSTQTAKKIAHNTIKAAIKK